MLLAESIQVNCMGAIIDEGWTTGNWGPYIDERKATELVIQRHHYLRPDVRETLRRTGVLIHDDKSGEYYVDTKKVLALRPYLADKLGGAPDRVLLRRSIGFVPPA